MNLTQYEFNKLSLKKQIQGLFELAFSIENEWDNDEIPKAKIDQLLTYLSFGEQWPLSIEKLKALSKPVFYNRDSFLNVLIPLEREYFRDRYEQELLITTKDKFEEGVKTITDDLNRVIVLENLRSQFNVGSIARSAEFFGFRTVIAIGYTPRFDRESVVKTAMGSHRHLNFLYFRNCIEAIHFLKEKHVFCLALETSLKSTSIDKWVINNNHMKSQSLAIFLGNERFGLSYNCLTQVDALVAIPAKGFKNSLNVSVAAGIAMNYFSD